LIHIFVLDALCPAMLVHRNVIERSSNSLDRMILKCTPKFYLFSQMIGETSMLSGVQFPVKISELKPDIRRALRHGAGNSL
jgi:hypothetical protein